LNQVRHESTENADRKAERMSNPTIFIIGAGAIGKALAVFLKNQGSNVVLVRATVDDSSHEENLTVTLNDNTSIRCFVTVTGLSRLGKLDGIVVLANKSFANEVIADRIMNIVGNSPIVIMQNGLNVEEPFIRRGFVTIFRCVLFSTSQTISSNIIRFKPVAVSPIGVIKGNSTALKSVASSLDTPHFRFDAIDNILPVVWRKTIANCVFNSICPLLDIDNGLFARDKAAMSVAERIIKECISVAREVGVLLDVPEVLEMVRLISKSSEGQLISTLQDIKEGRETEIDSLNFTIARIAKNLGKEHLAVETKLLGELTKLKAQLNC
jgi:2-dehydropantoate 2-reductase